MSRAIPFTVIGGFLGSGKTTLTNRLLATGAGTRFAVLVNDFGALNIDESLITAFDGTLMQLANGCICCSLAGGLVDAMLALMEQAEHIDHVLIEASGVSNPSRIMDFARVDQDLQPNMTLVLVDCVNFTDHLADHRLQDTLQDQLQSADVFLLTKTAIATDEQQEAVLSYLTRHSPNVPYITDQIDPAEILFQPINARSVSTQTPRHAHGLYSMAFRSNAIIDIQDVQRVLRNTKPTILRAKGRIQTIDGGYAYQQVGGQIGLTKLNEPIEHSELVLINTTALDDLIPVLEALGIAPL